MTNKKIWAATLFSTLLLTMTISSPVKAAELQTSTTVDRSQITLPLSEETEENLFSLESVSDIQMSELVDPDEVISVSDGDDTIQARKGTATKYGWSYGTTPYTFTQKWSTDTEVYSTYPYYNDGLLYPAATELLDAPSNSQYSSAVREGYVNDTWATEQSIVGAHVYYHKVSSNKALNSVTVLLDKNVAFQIYDAELNPVLDTSSDAYEDLLLFYRTAVKYDNYDKTVYTCKLTAGNYYIMFWDNKSNEGNHHYAMFTGNPLPIQQTYSAGGVFNGSVKWDGSSSSQTYQASGVTISVSNGTEDLFALYRVTFQDMGSSYFNTYIKSADMMYQSPNSYSYKTIANMANLNQKMIDYYPDEGSMMGTYNTKVKVNWMNGLSYVNASYSTNAMLYIDYLAPLGEVSVSF